MSYGDRKFDAKAKEGVMLAYGSTGSLHVLDKQLYDAAYDDKTAEVTRLLAAGADPNGHKDHVRACARAASQPAAPAPLPRPCQLRGTHHPHHAAAARRSMAKPP